MNTSSSELFEINVSNRLIFFGFIDEQKHSWILFKTFFFALSHDFKEQHKYYIRRMANIYTTHIKIIKITNPDSLRTVVIKKIHLQKNGLPRDFRLGRYILLDKDFFLNQYLDKSFDNSFWEYFKENYGIDTVYRSVVDNLAIAKMARDKINNLFVKKMASGVNTTINNNTGNRHFAIDNNSSIELFDDDKMPNIHPNKNITIDINELNNLITSAIENSIPKIVASVADILLTTSPGSGIKYYYADKITTIQPDTEQYFCIRDFLIEKKAGLIFLKPFGWLTARHYGKVAIKYLPPNSNSNQAGYNYYPIIYKPSIEKLFLNFIETIMPKNQAKEAVL